MRYVWAAVFGVLSALAAGAQVNNSSGAGGIQNPNANGGAGGPFLPTAGGTMTGAFISGVDPYVDPRAYGASCSNNPAVDDSTAITNALTVAQAKGEEVQIAGTCYIQHPIVWPTTVIGDNLGFGLRGASTGGTIRAATIFPDTGTETGAMIFRAYTDIGPAAQVTLHNITLDANSTASACATFEAQRLLFLDKVTCLSATGNGGGELNFGRTAGGAGLVGLTARDIEIDNNGIISAKGAAARPNYGMYMNTNASDGHVENVVVNQNAIAGVYVNSGNNDFTKIHPFGFTALQKPTATWPQYGVYLDTAAFTNWFNATQCDTVQTSCFFAARGFFTALNTDLECTDGGTGSLCGEFIVTAASGASRIHLYGGRLQAGSLAPTGSPVNWLGSVDIFSDWLVEWPSQQLGYGTANTLVLNSPLSSPTGTVQVFGDIFSSGSGNQSLQANSTSATAFSNWLLSNATNGWTGQVNGSAGSFGLKDNSTNNIVATVAEGAPAGALAIGTTSVVLGQPTTVQGAFTVNGGNIVAAGSGTPALQANSSSTSTFPYWQVQNATNGWVGQVGGTLGEFELKDNSTNRLVMTVAEGAPANSISVAAGGAVTEALSSTATGVTGTLGESDTKVATNAQVANNRASIEIPLPLGGTASFTSTGNTSGIVFTPVQAITIDSIGAVAMVTQAVTCTTSPVLSVFVAGSPVACSYTITNSTFTPAPGSCAVAVAAGQTVAVKVSTAAVGCATPPANVTTYLQYH